MSEFSCNRNVYILYMDLPGEEIINMKPKYPFTFDHLEFFSRDAHVNVLFVKVLLFLPGRMSYVIDLVVVVFYRRSGSTFVRTFEQDQ